MTSAPNRRQFTALCATALAPAWALADTPAPLARVIAGFPAGGTVDLVARQLAEQLRGRLATQVIVDNKAGAGGRLAITELKQAPNDGLTLLQSPSGPVTMLPHTFRRLTYDPFADLTPVSLTTRFDFAFAVGPAVPATVRTLKDYFDWVRAHPQQDTFASPSAGVPPHFIGELLGRAGGVPLRAVHYRGSQPGILDLVGGQIPAMCTTLPDLLPFHRDGKLRILGTSGAQPSPFTPEVATFAQQGHPDLVFVDWYAVFLRGDTPAPLREKVSAQVRAALQAPRLVEALQVAGVQAAGSRPEETVQLARDDHRRWGELVRSLGFVPE